MMSAAAMASQETLQPLSSLRVLVITPDPRQGYGPEMVTLLHEHGIPSEIASWEEATAERTPKFDVLIVTGKGRSPDRGGVRLDLKKPVLAVGPYGCKYLGFLDLKNGHPYT